VLTNGAVPIAQGAGNHPTYLKQAERADKLISLQFFRNPKNVSNSFVAKEM
jgi:hypothetical protein